MHSERERPEGLDDRCLDRLAKVTAALGCNKAIDALGIKYYPERQTLEIIWARPISAPSVPPLEAVAAIAKIYGTAMMALLTFESEIVNKLDGESGDELGPERESLGEMFGYTFVLGGIKEDTLCDFEKEGFCLAARVKGQA